MGLVRDTDQCPQSSLQLLDVLPLVQHRGANCVAQVRNHVLEDRTKERERDVCVCVREKWIGGEKGRGGETGGRGGDKERESGT